jgi:hypothetical protein
MDQVGKLMAFEAGELNQDETIALFAELVKSGLVWQLQGSYGRAAHSLIERGYIDRAGNILACVDCS